MHEHAAVVARYVEAFFALDVEAALALMHPNMRLITLRPGLVLNRDQLEHVLGSEEPGYDHLDERREFDEPVLLPDERVLSVFRVNLTWRETGEHAATIVRGVLFTLEDGLIVEQRNFPSPEAARLSVELDRSDSAAPAA